MRQSIRVDRRSGVKQLCWPLIAALAAAAAGAAEPANPPPPPRELPAAPAPKPVKPPAPPSLPGTGPVTPTPPPATPTPGSTTPPAPPVARKFQMCPQKNGDLTPGLPVRYEAFDTPRLRELRVRENLNSVVAGGRGEFERILLLKDWVAAQFPHGNPNPYPPWDAITVLDWIRSGKTGGFCGQYSQVLLQSLASLGLTARYVELGGSWNPYVHFVIEVWSNQFDKWVVLDADYNVHFERGGIPLSALEVHDALVESRLSDVETIKGTAQDGEYDAYEWPLKLAEVFYYVRLHLKADHLSSPDEPPFDRYNDMVEWLNPLTLPWEFNPGPSSYVIERLTNLQSGDRADFSEKLNQVLVTVNTAPNGGITLRFANNVFDFDHYQLRIREPDSVDGKWFDYDAAMFRWPPTWERRIVEVRGVNTRGVPGPASRVLVCSEAQGAACRCDAP
jgi:hypothetical protein